MMGQIPLSCKSAVTYKQALRGLFVTGTSPVRQNSDDSGKGRLMNQD